MTESRLEEWRSKLASQQVIDVVNAILYASASRLPGALVLLETAGANLRESDWAIRIEDVSLREFLAQAKERLRNSIPKGAVDQKANIRRIFISYSTVDRAKATKVALALQRSPDINVFIDRWELGPGERLARRLEIAVQEAGLVIVLLSKDSASSEWVAKEIEHALNGRDEAAVRSIVLLRIDDAAIPGGLDDVVHIDWRDTSNDTLAIQSLLDVVRGEPSFAARVGALLRSPTQHNVAAERARDILVDLAPADFFHSERNQQWLIWELFHRVLPQYPVSVIVRPKGAETIEFEFIDRWNRTRNQVVLSWDSVRAGMWQAKVDLQRERTQREEDLVFTGDLGRLSYRHNPAVGENRIVPIDATVAAAERDRVFALFDKALPQVQIELLDLVQRAVGPKGWHSLDVVVGGAHTSLSLAVSANVQPPKEPLGPGILVELWDPFFGALKSTCMLQSQLEFGWGRDVDLFEREFEFFLGLE